MYPEDESIAEILTDAGLISRDESAQAKEQAKVAGNSAVSSSVGITLPSPIHWTWM